jgi:AraC-like DNA-binding protein
VRDFPAEAPSASERPSRGAGCLALRHGLRYAVADGDAGFGVAAACGDRAGVWICVALAGELLIDGIRRSIPVQPGTLRIIDFEIAAWRWARPDTPNLGVVIFLPDGWCASCPCGGECPVFRLRHREADAEARGEPASMRLDDHAAALVRSLIEDAADAHLLHHEATILRLLCWLQQAPGTATRAGPVQIRADLADKIRRAAAILEGRRDDPPTISELARLAAMNECDLKRLFKRVFGQSIGSYSRARRLEAARHLLVHSSLNIADVALEVGFRNPSRFATAFRSHFGRNPADFRRERAGTK